MAEVFQSVLALSPVKTLESLDGMLSSLEELGYERYSIVDDEYCTVEIEHLAGLVSVHFTPLHWSPEWYKYYLDLWECIQEVLLDFGDTRVVNLIHRDEPKKIKLHKLFGFTEHSYLGEYVVLVKELEYGKRT